MSENTKSAKIEIYNLKGQKIKTIKLPNRSVGNIGVSWEGTDKQNHRLPSGMYILKLQENGRLKAISKCIFLK
jgi:flagellar hook assembly protein FlgD